MREKCLERQAREFLPAVRPRFGFAVDLALHSFVHRPRSRDAEFAGWFPFARGFLLAAVRTEGKRSRDFFSARAASFRGELCEPDNALQFFQRGKSIPYELEAIFLHESHAVLSRESPNFIILVSGPSDLPNRVVEHQEFVDTYAASIAAEITLLATTWRMTNLR